MRSERVQLVLISLVACLWWAITFAEAGAQDCHNGGCSMGGMQSSLRMGERGCRDGSCSLAGGGHMPQQLTYGAARPKAPTAAELRAMIPDERFANDPSVLIYTDQSMPRIYQMPVDGGHSGFHIASYNISAVAAEPVGNANGEFPWREAGGTHRCRDQVVAFRFLKLPEGRPVVWYRDDRGPMYAPIAWMFPEGATVGEVLVMRCLDGVMRPFELRLRERLERSWAVDVLKPVVTAAELEKAIALLRRDGSEQYASAEAVQHHVARPVQLAVRTLEDHHPRQSFRVSAEVDSLPNDDPQLQAALLTQFKFHSALGRVWRGETCHAVSGLLTPANYDGTFMGLDETSCNRCHRDVGKHVDFFQPGRDWYGYVSGGDGIFSLSFMQPDAVSHNGYPRRPAMLDVAGFCEPYDPARHLDYYRLEEQR